jgi:hypothetical protein
MGNAIYFKLKFRKTFFIIVYMKMANFSFLPSAVQCGSSIEIELISKEYFVLVHSKWILRLFYYHAVREGGQVSEQYFFLQK